MLQTAIHGGISVTCLLVLIEKRIGLNLTFYMNVTFGLSYINIQITKLSLLFNAFGNTFSIIFQLK